MSLIDKDALRIERKIGRKTEESKPLTDSQGQILELIDAVIDDGFIYDVQQQLTEANNHQMQRLACSHCGHHLMARVGQSLLFKVYPCIHCKRAMKPTL